MSQEGNNAYIEGNGTATQGLDARYIPPRLKKITTQNNPPFLPSSSQLLPTQGTAGVRSALMDPRPGSNMRTAAPMVPSGEDGVGRAGHVFYFRREEWVYGRQKGVELANGRKMTARREIVICARAYRTPQVLMISGVGPSAVLEEHGIPVAYDAPQGSQNFYRRFALYLEA
ncbi:hypothetical protein EKO27_g2645 [Xylaria grammica]|uniref:Uncharacterized protein n=1 Tax=Xylaria grammica TaxID=363999 RepID=A0A439DDN9_9PEZI|nr:hypothetical protein EKO27_g2645 [Xylaria grammica]